MRETTYAAVTPLEHRRRFGQFFTPRSVADLMVSWVLGSKPKSVLDPAFGLGVFFDSFLENTRSDQCEYQAYEIDENIISYFQPPSNIPFRLRLADYCVSDSGRFDGIVCNPPYMRFQKFMNRRDVVPLVEKNAGVKLAGYTNMASVFLIKSIKELNKGGRLAYIMPFEFFNTGYGTEVKRKLMEDGLLKQVIFFLNEKDIFPDAVTTVCVLLCSKDGARDPISITRVEGFEELSDLNEPIGCFQHVLPREALPFNRKWSPIISSLYENIDAVAGSAKIYEYGGFSRGIATGANAFFSLNREKIRTWGLGGNYRKCITKSPQVKKLVFTETDFIKLEKSGAPIYCLDVKKRHGRKAANYIRYGQSLGFHERYLARNRAPWYRLEARDPAPILVGVFNRGKVKVVRNFTDAINFTCFHSFYPNMFGEGYVNRLFVYLVSTAGQKAIMANKRRYGAGLDKFEPGDLNECRCPSAAQFDRCAEKEAEKVIETAMKDESQALIMADELMKNVLREFN